MTDLVFNVTILDLSSVSKFSTFIDDSKLLYRFLYVNQYSNSNVKESLGVNPYILVEFIALNDLLTATLTKFFASLSPRANKF